MKKRLYISNDEAGFFDNNKMLCLDNPPTQGDFIVGDIVISNRQENGIFGWVCVLAGSPGRWEVICDLRLIQEAVDKLEQRQETIVNGDISTIKKQINQMAAQALAIDKEHKEELKKLNDKVSTNTTNILNINNDIKGLQQSFETLDEIVGDSIAGFSAQIQINADKIEANSNNLSELENEFEKTLVNIENVIKEIQSTDEAQTDDIQNVFDKVVNIEQNIVKINQEINVNKETAGGQLEDLSTQVSTNTTNITQLQVSFAEIDADLDEVKKAADEAVIKVGSIESVMDDNSVEIEDIKKGLVGALVSSGVNANVGMTWKELFELILNNASGGSGDGEVTAPGELILYKDGAINETTEFGSMVIDSTYLLDEYIDLDIGQDGVLLWFGFKGKIDFSKYESAIIEINNVAEHASSIGISRNNCTGYGYESGLTSFDKEFILCKNEVVIEEGSVIIHTLSFSDLYTDEDKEGYFGIYVTREAGTGGAINDEIIINSITVIPKPLVPCTGLSLNKSELSLNVGGASSTLVATILPEGCTDEVVWKSTNNAVATVDQNGVVTPKAVGSCNIRVTCGELTMNCAVTVNAAAGSCTGITLKQHPITLELGQTINTNTVYEILPAGCIDEVQLIFSSVISVTNGVIKGEQVGSTTLTIKCGNHTASLVVNVIDAEVPEVEGNGIVLFRNGTMYDNTEFRNICKTPSDGVDVVVNEAMYYNLTNAKQHMWISYDGYVDFSLYDRVDVTIYTENSTQQPNLGIGITSKSGQYGYAGGSGWEGTPHTYQTIMTNKTKTTYSLKLNYTGSGYLLLWMNNGDTNVPGGVYITEIIVYPKENVSTDKPCTGIYFTQATGLKITGSETLNLNNYLVVQPDGCTDEVTWTTDSNAVAVTDGVVTVLAGGFAKVQARCGGYAATVTVEAVKEVEGGIVLLSDGEYFGDTEFGVLCATPLIRDDIDTNGALVYELNTVYSTAFFSFGDSSNDYVNFNNYDAVEITIYTENNQQTPIVTVSRAGGSSGQYGYGQTVYPIDLMESVTFGVNTTKEPTVYTVNMAELRKLDADMGHLVFTVERGTTGDGKVYISKIVVYPEGTYYTESIDE